MSILTPADECELVPRLATVAEEVDRLRASGYERREVSRILGIDEEAVVVAEVLWRSVGPPC